MGLQAAVWTRWSSWWTTLESLKRGTPKPLCRRAKTWPSYHVANVPHRERDELWSRAAASIPPILHRRWHGEALA